MPGERRVTKERINILLVLFITILILTCDQITKVVVQNIIPQSTSIPIIKNVFNLTLVFNKGAAFGIFKTQTILFIVVGIITFLLMVFYLPHLKKESIFIKIGFASVLGGILGNLIDRLRFGYVVDFLDFLFWPVFNIADSAITVGAALIIIYLLRKRR